MLCKNCKVELANDNGFCQDCGARVLGDTITLKFVFQEILDKVLSVDNRLLKTFVHLFTKPHVVVESYIRGVRKRYYNPFSYMLISLTLAGIIAYINKDVVSDMLQGSSDAFGNTTAAFNEKMLGFMTESGIYQCYLYSYLCLLIVGGILKQERA